MCFPLIRCKLNFIFNLGGVNASRINSVGNANNEEDKDESSVGPARIYCVECGTGISNEEGFLDHLFTWRAAAVQNKIKDQFLSRATLQQALDYSSEDKRIWFRENLSKLRISYFQDNITLVLSRDNVLDETLNQFSTVDSLSLHKDIKIFFIDEEARDAGGVIREWLSLVTEKLLLPEAKNFEMVQNDNDIFYTIHPEASFEMLHFAGQIFGKAVFEGIPIDCLLSKLLVMKILGLDPTLADLKYYDANLYNSLSYLNNEDVNIEDLYMTYSITDNGVNVDLIENGSNVPITKENKDEYINSIVEYYSYKRAETPMVAFLTSFLAVIPVELCSVFDIEQFESVLFGQKEIDIEDWKSNSYYKGKYSETHPTIVWFWDILKDLNNQEKRKFLQFCTGSRSLPVEGFKGLKGQKKQLCKFSIESVSLKKCKFLRAHTCFNSLELPLFESKDDLNEGIQFVLDQEEFHFGLE